MQSRSLETHNDFFFNQTSCLCPDNTTSDVLSRGPTLEEFIEEFQTSLQEVENTTFIGIEEKHIYECADVVTTFAKVVSIEFDVLCSLLEDDIPLLESAFVGTYNNITSEYFCNTDYFITLENATAMTVGSRTVEDEVTIDFLVEGSCRGCDPDTVNVFSPAVIPSSGMDDMQRHLVVHSSQNQNRRVFNEISSSSSQCSCSAYAHELRGPTEVEFVAMFEKEIESEQIDLLCVQSIGTCSYPTTFETALVIGVVGWNPIVTDVSHFVQEDLEQLFLDSLNGIYESTSENCNTEYRLVQQVTALFNIDDFDPAEVFDTDSHRKILEDQVHGSRRLQIATSFPTSTVSPAPAPWPTAPPSTSLPSASATTDSPSSPSSISAVPTMSTPPTASPSISASPSAPPSISAEPSTSPSSPPSIFIAYSVLYISGICNGCSSELLPKHLSSTQRSLMEDDRFLQDIASPYETSNCFCPANATASGGGTDDEKTSGDLAAAFNNALADQESILTVSETYEVDVFDCHDEMDEFMSDVSLRFLLDGTNDVASVTTLVEETYNELVHSYCDPLDRRDISLEFVDLSLGSIIENGCSLYTIQWNVTGKCRGCDDMTSILDTEESNEQSMRLLNEGMGDDKRRRVTGSSLCFCPTGTVTSRAPTLTELYVALEDALQAQPVGSTGNICGVGMSAEPSQAPSSVPTEQFCNVTDGNSFSSEVLLSVSVHTGETIAEAEYDALGDTFQTVYNTLMDETFKTCDEQYRIVSSVTASNDGLQSRRMADDRTNPSSTLRGMERRIQESDTQVIVLAVSGLCDSCGSDSDFFDVLNLDDFLSLYSATVLTLIPSIDSIVGFREVNFFPCSDDVVEFTEVVIIEYVVDCLDPLFNDSQTEQVEQAFVSTYNGLMLDYCDPFQRTVRQAELLRVGVNTTASGNIPVEFEISASCRGCNPNATGIYDIPTAIASNSRRLTSDEYLTENQERNLQDDDICYCSAQPIGDRAPFESEFIDSYQVAIESLQLQCIASVGLCDFGTVFDTGIVLNIGINSTELTDQLLLDIEESFKATVNGLYSNDNETCNPDFRLVESVQATVVTTNPVRRRLDPFFDRKLQIEGNATSSDQSGNGTATDDDDTNNNNTVTIPANFTLSPTSSPTFFVRPVSPETSTAIFLFVRGVCNGCVSDITVSDQVIAGRNLFGRMLQNVQSEAVSNCYCAIGAFVDPVAPSTEELEIAFEDDLDEREIELEVETISEVAVADCDADSRKFETDFEYSINLFGGLQSKEASALAKVFEKTYNTLAEDFCDDARRVITDLKVRSFTTVEATDEQCVTSTITFRVKGRCLGCRDGTELFEEGDDTPMRRSLPGRSVENVRRIAIETECFCIDETGPERAPTLAEFNEVFEKDLDDAKIRNVCGFDPVVQPTLAPVSTAAPTKQMTPFPTFPTFFGPTISPAPFQPFPTFFGPTLSPAPFQPFPTVFGPTLSPAPFPPFPTFFGPTLSPAPFQPFPTVFGPTFSPAPFPPFPTFTGPSLSPAPFSPFPTFSGLPFTPAPFPTFTGPSLSPAPFPTFDGPPPTFPPFATSAPTGFGPNQPPSPFPGGSSSPAPDFGNNTPPPTEIDTLQPTPVLVFTPNPTPIPVGTGPTPIPPFPVQTPSPGPIFTFNPTETTPIGTLMPTTAPIETFTPTKNPIVTTPLPVPVPTQPPGIPIQTPSPGPVFTPPPIQFPVETPMPTQAPVVTPAPTTAPVKTPMPTKAPVKTPIPTKAPVKTSMPTKAPVKTPIPTKAPVKTPMPTKAPVKTPMPTQAPVETPFPTKAPVETPMPTKAPVETPFPTKAPVETPFPTAFPVFAPFPDTGPGGPGTGPGDPGSSSPAPGPSFFFRH